MVASDSGPDYTGVSTEDLAQAIEHEFAAGRMTRDRLVRILADEGGGDACRKITRILQRETKITALALADRILTALSPQRCVTIHDFTVLPLKQRGSAKRMATDEWWVNTGEDTPDPLWLVARIEQLETAREDHLGNG